MTSTERWRKWNDRRRAAGHPPRRNPPTKQALWSRASYYRKRARGECAKCQERAVEGHSMCRKHLDAQKVITENTRREHRHTSPKWSEIEAQMSRQCPRCELRGPHECIPARADGSRRVAWEVL